MLGEADKAGGAESDGSANSELSFGAMPTREYWQRVTDVSALSNEQRVWEARSVRGVDINAHLQRLSNNTARIPDSC